MRIIAYFLYGASDEYKLELALSVISAITQENKQLEDALDRITYCVVTDQKKIPYDLPVEILHLEPGELANWTDNGAYNHRAKPLAMLKVLDYYKCPVAMIDTDTYFIDTPQIIFEKIDRYNSVMHDFEYLIGSQSIWVNLLAKINGCINLGGYVIDGDSPMFNSGVVGLSFDNRHLLCDSLAIIDELNKIDSVFNIEQFAVGLSLNKKTKIHVCKNVVRHYWGIDRDFYRIQASRFFQDFSINNLAKNIDSITSQKFGTPRIPLSFKFMARVLCFLRGWTDAQRFSYICHLCEKYYSKKDTKYASAWRSLANSANR